MVYPNKPANNQYPIHALIQNRWSPRLFADKLIEPDKINSLFEAASWAPSSFNGQPWRFVYATKDQQEDFKRLSSVLAEGNVWAKDAPLLMAIFARENFEYNDKPNYNFMYDTGAATENLFLEAVNQGLMGHEMIGFDKEKLKEVLGVPEGFKPCAMMAIGYPPTQEQLAAAPADRQKSELAERQRKSLEEIVFQGSWNENSKS